MRNLLIVDDERTIREGISRCLNWESLGIETVLTASNGNQAYDILKKEKIHIVVADIVMPELTGIELIEKCRLENMSVEFVILSSHDDFSFAQKALKNNVCDYLLKPCNPEELKNIILNLVEKLDKLDINNSKFLMVQKRMETLLPHAKSQLLHNLIHTLPENEQRVNEFFSLLQLKPDRYYLLLMPLMLTPNIPASIKQVMNDIMERFEGCVSCHETDRFIVLTRHTSQNSFTEILQYMQDCARKLNLVDTSIIVSELGDLQDISKGYTKAVETSRLLFYFNKIDIIYANSVNLIDYSVNTLEMESYIHLLAESIQSSKTAEVLSLLNEIFELFKSNFYCFKAVQEISLRIYLIIINSSQTDDRYYTGKFTLINEAFSVQNIYEILVHEISHIVIVNEENLYDTYSKAVRTAIDYINENFMDYNLSLNQIASTVLFMNTDYFGKLFKNECGIKFSNYLLALRMKKAKQLLSTTDVSISYVAEQVGFPDNHTYFSQLFKKYTGVLPKDYKSSLQKKKGLSQNSEI